MKIPDFSFGSKLRIETDFMDFYSAVASIFNLGRYQMRIISTIPTWTGEGGEHLLYISGTVRRLYWYDDINATWHFLEWNSSGLGQPAIVNIISLTGQTGDIAATTIYTPPAQGLYKISVYMICTTAAAGTLSCTIGWTDIVGAKTVSPTSTVDLSSTANGALGDAFISATAVAITYSTAIADKVGSPAYALYLCAEKIS